MAQEQGKPGKYIWTLLRDHFGDPWREMTVIEDRLELADHPNLQSTLDHLSRRIHMTVVTYGTSIPGLKYAEKPPLFWNNSGHASHFNAMQRTRALQFTTHHVGSGSEVIACLKDALVLIRDADGSIAVLIQEEYSHDDRAKNLKLEIMASTAERAIAFVRQLHQEMNSNSVYRGRMISLCDDRHGHGLRFHDLPSVAREDIILADETLNRIEQNTLGFYGRAERLQRAGRHLKRGILLHGPPGTGKTFTLKYLAHRLKGRSAFLLTGESLMFMDRMCRMAVSLQPSTVIMEDIDLIAEERTANSRNSLLFDLLNHMDGMGDDSNVLFLLTTNRPDLLEPALASRPGRIDQAIEIPLPDHDCRRRLIERYARGLSLHLKEPEQFVRRTDGASAAFIRELMRKAATLAATDGEAIRVQDEHLDEALRELVLGGGRLTRSLLGASRIGFDAE